MAERSGLTGVAFTTQADYDGGSPTWTTIPIDDIEQDGIQWPKTETATKEALDGTDGDKGKKMTMAYPFLDAVASYIATLKGYAAAKTRVVFRHTFGVGETSYIGATAAAASVGVRIYFDADEKANYGENPVEIMSGGCAAGRSIIPIYRA